MNNTINKVFLFLLAFSISHVAFSQPTINIHTTLTDQFNNGTPGESKNSFTKDTPIIYIIWKSDQLKQGQKVKAVWIADDTHNVAPANYKIDEAEMVLDEGMKGKILNNLPGTFWDGKFSMSKPNNGWPVGQYHTDIFVDGTLVKSIQFNVAEATAANTAPKKINNSDGWGAIATDTTAHDKDRAYGIGGGASKEEAEKNAQKFCTDAGGEQCNVVVTYQQCGAVACSKDHLGVGIGDSKELSEKTAKNDCKDADCSIIASDCN